MAGLRRYVVRRYVVPGVGLGTVALTAFAVTRVRSARSGGGSDADRDHPPPAPVSVRAEGQIAAADADTMWLATELRRITPLVRTGSLSRQTLDRTTHDLAAARARHTTAEATARRLQAVIAKTRIVAPITGTIVSRAVEPGEVLVLGMPLVTIVDLRRRRVEAEVDEYDTSRVHPGDAVTITAEGYGPQRWEGTVESIADVMVPRRVKPQDPGRFSDTRVLPVKVTLPADAPLKIE